MNNKDKKDLKDYYSDVKLSEKEKNMILNDLHQLSSQKNNICFVESKRKFFKPAVSVALSVCLITSALSYSKYHSSHDIPINNEEKETTYAVTLETSITTLWEEIIQNDKITSPVSDADDKATLQSNQIDNTNSEQETEENNIKNTDNNLGSTETAGSTGAIQSDTSNIQTSIQDETSVTNITDNDITVIITTKIEPTDKPIPADTTTPDLEEEPTAPTMSSTHSGDVTRPPTTSATRPSTTTIVIPSITIPKDTTRPPTTSAIRPSTTTIVPTITTPKETTRPATTTVTRDDIIDCTTQIECTTQIQPSYTIITEPADTPLETTGTYFTTCCDTTTSETTTTTTEYYSTTTISISISQNVTTKVTYFDEEPVTTQPPQETFY